MRNGIRMKHNGPLALAILLSSCALPDVDARNGDDPRAEEREGQEGEGEGEGEAAEGEGEGEGETGEGEGEGEGEAAEGEGEPPPPPDTPLELRTDDEVCGQWRAWTPFAGAEWQPLGDGSDSCDAGFMPDGAQDAAIARVNLYRWLAGLPPVALADGLVEQQQACAAVLVGLGGLDHHPPASAPCYTSAGAAGAGSSNLAMGTSAASSVDLFVEDPGVSSLGHRRWVLNPSAQVTAFGHKGPFTCMYSFSGGGSASPDFVSWPPAGPVPVDAAFGRGSFGTSLYGTTAETRVSVNVDGAGFVEVPFTDLGFGYGSLATTLAFDIPGGWPSPGRTVEVEITGLRSAASTDETVRWATRYVACP